MLEIIREFEGVVAAYCVENGLDDVVVVWLFLVNDCVEVVMVVVMVFNEFLDWEM